MKPLIRPQQYALFYLFKAEVRFYRLQGESLRLQAVWQRQNPEHLAAFRRFAAELNGQPVMVLLESEDQIIQYEKIPYLIGWDRYALIDRKLAMMGQGADKTLAYFISLGRSVGANKNKQEALILVAAADSADYLPWLLAIREAKAHLVAVTTETLVTASTARMAGNVEGVALHVSWNRGGVVQTVLDKGYPLFARFCPWPSQVWSETSGWAWEMAQDETVAQTQKLLHFLQGRGLWSPSLRTALNVVLPASLAHIQPQWPTLAGITWRTVIAPEQTLGQHLNLPPPAPQTWLGAESMALMEMAALPKLFQLAPRDLRLRFLNWQAMRYTWRVAGGLLALMLLVALYFGGYWGHYAWQNRKVNQQWSETQANYQTMSASFPKIGISLQDLRGAVDLTDAIRQCYPGLPPLLLGISDMNERHPNIDLVGLSWQHEQAPDKNSNKGAGAALQCAEKYTLEGAVSAEGKQSQRDIQQTFDHWLTALTQLSAEHKITVTIKTPPLDLTQGKYSENAPAPTKANFVVELSLSVPIEPVE